MLYNPAVVFSIPLLVPQRCLYPLASHLREDYDKFFEFSKNAEDGSLRAGRPPKTCPDVPNEFRVSGGNPESLLIIALGFGILMG